MLKDLRYNDFWHIEENTRSLPTDRYGHYDPSADKYPYILTRDGKRSKKLTRNQYNDAKTEVKNRNLRDFGIWFNPTVGQGSEVIVYGSKGQYLQHTHSEVYNANWWKLQSMETLDSNQTMNLKYTIGDCFVWCDRSFIEDYNYDQYGSNPHHTQLVYVFDSNRCIAIYLADHDCNGDGMSDAEIDYVIQARKAILKKEIESIL